MPDRVHITTAIFYSNGQPHVGHASEAFAADVFARHYRRRLGNQDVSFVTGTDEHGDKNYRAAIKAGLKPKEFVDGIAEVFKQGFDLLNISYDFFVRTTDEKHQKFVQAMLQRAYDKDRYKDRNLVERFWFKLKQYRRVATRYEKTARNFMGFILVASITVLLR